MTEAIAFVAAAIFVTVTVVALMAVINTLFPRSVEDGRQVADRLPGRTLLFGLLNGFFLGVLTSVCLALGNNGAQIFFLPGLALLTITTLSITFGLTSIALLIGQRMFPKKPLLQQMLAGSLALTLACLVPFVGWFGLLPYAIIWGLGAVALGVYQRRWPVVVEQSVESEPH